MNHPLALLGVVAALPVLLALRPAQRPPVPPAGGACELRLVERARTPSQRCLACHDGSVGVGDLRAPHDGRSRSGLERDGDGNHPSDVDYGRAFLRRPTALRPSALLPRSLPLVDGKVACTTCHDGASHERAKAALRGSALCFACHAT